MSRGGDGKVVCVTGGSGYIASWLVKLLLQRGYSVKTSVRDPNDPKKTEHLLALDGAKERLHLFKADLLEEGAFDPVVDGCEGVFHTASPVSLSPTDDPQVAASIAFLIARYFARERILKLVEGNKKFLAIDKAIGENGFKVVTLLRLSPLLPFSLGNYLYGLTSVKFIPYVLGSWLGMLPGTWAYVSAGAFGRAIIQEESELGLREGNGAGGLWTLGLGLLVTAIAATYVTRLAKDAVKDID